MAAKKARIEDYELNPPRHPHFRANPIPRACSVLIYDEKLRREQRERDERINQNAKISIKKAKMPEAMQTFQLQSPDCLGTYQAEAAAAVTGAAHHLLVDHPPH